MTEPNEITQRFVVAVDFTPASEYALVEAIRLAQQMRGTVLHVVNVLPVDPWIKTDGVERQSEAIDTTYNRLRELVLEVGARTTGHRWDQAVSFHVRLGDAGPAIHQVAVDVNADMIIVGTEGRRGLEKLLLGSVASRLIAEAHMPVLVARPKEIDGLPRTPTLAPPKPGAPLHSKERDMHVMLELGPPTPHIVGLI